MEFSELEQLIELVQKADISELTLLQGKGRVTLRKSERPATTKWNSANTSEFDYAATYEVDEDELLDEDIARELPHCPVLAPLVGIFGLVKPAIGPGSRVTKGQVIGIIEAMDLITEIKSVVDGVVREVYIKDNNPVEYGQVIFEIDLN